MKEFQVLKFGLCEEFVCSSLTPEETVRRANQETEEILRRANIKLYPGHSITWSIVEGDVFADGSPPPWPCEKWPETHKHYLLSMFPQ